MLKFKSAMIALAILFFATTAQAQNFTEAGADEIKTEIQSWLDQQIALATPHKTTGAVVTGDHIETTGALTVTPEEGYYAAKLPFITLRLADGERFDIGQIALNIIPDEDNNLWRVTMALPKTMSLFDAAEEPQLKLTLGQQHFGGLWDPSRHIYIRYDGDYHDLKIERQDPSQVSSIGRVQMMQNLQPAAEMVDLYSGPMNASFSDINLALPSIGRLKIESLSTENLYHQVPLFDSNNFQKQLLEAQTTPAAELSKIFTSFSGLLDLLPASIASNLGIRNLEFTGTDDFAGQHFTMSGFSFMLDADHLKSDAARVSLSYSIDDFEVTGFEESQRDYLPSSGQVSLDISNLALQSIIPQFDNSGDTPSEGDPELSDMNIPQLLAEHGVTISLDGTRLHSEKMDTNIYGTLRGTPDAANLFTGNIRIGVRGLDQATLDLQRMIKADPDNKDFLQQLFLASTVAQGLGQPGPDGMIRFYDFEFLEDGQVTLNGLNFTDLINSQAH